MNVYISGRITGLSFDEVEQMFDKAEKRLTDTGFTPVNPLKNGLSRSSTWEEHMKRDIAMLLECDAIYILSNWKESRGAALERHIAKELGLMIIEQMNAAE